jgi:predicted ATPase/transcriptional regulator with GAF, ATPase, and Fis domain
VLADFFKIGVGVAAELGALHRRGGMHGQVTRARVRLEGDLLTLEPPSDTMGPHPRLVLGELAYMAPEQSGRINRSADYRADFYALGVLLYEELTHRLPFSSDDALELIHFHVARSPIAPIDLDPEIPEVISAIVMKLLAKAPEDRYQSGAGLKHDLERARFALETPGAFEAFPLGERDVPEQLIIPRVLFGRSRDVSQLLDAFAAMCNATTRRPSLFLVSGSPGIGKTTLIEELSRPIVRERGYFVSGKFDQVVQGVPFGALIQAFRGLIRQLLGESPARFSRWKERIAAALGANGGVLTEVIPELEWVIGKQAAPPGLGSLEAQNRFHLVFQQLVAVFAVAEHPLVVFLDDLQWADPATLNLLQPLLTSESARHLFLMGAYRDTELDAGHRLTVTLSALERCGVDLPRITLGPLNRAAMTAFVREAIHGDLADAEPLAQLVYEKTQGNPFFAGQFLKALEQDGCLRLDRERGRFVYRTEEIARAPLPIDVIDLMTRKIARLPAGLRDTLLLAACVGGPFQSATLAMLSERSEAEISLQLAEAVAQGLVTLQDDGAYTFLHDRVQQAAYALIPGAQKKPVHLRIGRLLQEGSAAAGQPDRLLTVAHHLNLGSALITDPQERVGLARINLDAGRKAKAATAFDAARSLFDAGTRLLSEGDWSHQYPLCFELSLEHAESLNLCQEFDAADRACDELVARAQTDLERAQVLGLRMVQEESRSRFREAVQWARDALLLFDVQFPETSAAQDIAVDQQLAKIETLLNGRSIASLLDLPVMTDAAVRMVMNVLTTAWAPAYISGGQALTRLISATMVRLSLEHGNCEESAYGYATHAITAGPLRENYAAAFEYGTLALAINERFDDRKRRAKIFQQFHAHAQLWRRPLADCIESARQVTRIGLETGDFTYAVYGAMTETWVAITITHDLPTFVRDYSRHFELFAKLKAWNVADGHRILINWARALMGETQAPTLLSDAQCDENAFLEKYADEAFFAVCYVVSKLQICFLMGDPAGARAAADIGSTLIENLAGTIWPLQIEFWNGLVQAGSLTSPPGESPQLTQGHPDLARAESLFLRLAESCPQNYRCQFLMLRAERARVELRPLDALEAYEAAILQADAVGPPQFQALARELCGRFWLRRGQRSVALAFLKGAGEHYAAWGATAKVAAMRHEFAELRDPPSTATTGDAGAHDADSVRSGEIDLRSTVKAAEALAGEIELRPLLVQLMRIALENAGAERGTLLVEGADQSFTVASASIERPDVVFRDGMLLEQLEDVPLSVVHYVRRTRELVVFGDAQSNERHGLDPHILRVKPRSLLCLPVLHQSRLVGVLYLENRYTGDAFTEQRASVCRALASHAATALANAQLVANLRSEVALRTRAEADLLQALTQLEALKNRLDEENAYLKEEIQREHNFEEMVGSSRALLDIVRNIELVSPTDATVLITGETGTGKELVARAIHNRSERRGHRLVKVNCGAISAGLVESELFGHVRGAFTGALERRTGRFELADGGTLFLDEVGELPQDTQVKLLRVLQESEFEPVGSSRTVRVDVRIIAATNRDLEQAVAEGRFRADLYYRLNVVKLTVPPLRERASDIPELANFFLTRFARKFGKQVARIDVDSMRRLSDYWWPGNVRELGNVIERGVVLARGPALQILPDQLATSKPVGAQKHSRSVPPQGRDAGVEQAGSVTAPGAASAPESDIQGRSAHSAALQDVERDHILAVLETTGGVVEGPRGAATILKLHPNTLRSRMKRLGIR